MPDRNTFGILLISGAVATSAIAVALVTSSLGTGGATENTGAPTLVARSVAGASQTNAALLDSDGDGLPDWQEEILGTDPNNPDSDEDGTSDGDEVPQEGAGSAALGGAPGNGEAYVAPAALSSTDALARELFVGYADARADGSLDARRIETSIQDIVGRYTASSLASPAFTLNDITVEDDVSLSAYAGSVASALDAARQVREYELSVFARAVEAQGGPELRKLTATASVYRAIRDSLVTLEVPKSVASEHLALVNGLSALIRELERMSAWSGDPLDALVLVGTYGAAEDAMVRSIDTLFALLGTLET